MLTAAECGGQMNGRTAHQKTVHKIRHHRNNWTSSAVPLTSSCDRVLHQVVALSTAILASAFKHNTP